MAKGNKNTDNFKGFERLIQFARGQERRHEWRPTTTHNMITALRAVIGVLDDGEPRTPDYVGDNLDTLLRRWLVKTDGKTASARDYQKRVETLLTEFRRWEEDPLNFRTEIVTRVSRKSRSTASAAKRATAPSPAASLETVDEFSIGHRGTFKWSWEGDEEYTVADAQRFAYYLVLKASDFTPPPIVPPAAHHPPLPNGDDAGEEA